MANKENSPYSFDRYTRQFANDTVVSWIVNNRKSPQEFQGTSSEKAAVKAYLTKDLQLLAPFQPYEILGEINRDFFEGKAKVAYIFGTRKSGFVLQPHTSQDNEIFIGLIKDPDVYNTGHFGVIGLGLGSGLKDERDPFKRAIDNAIQTKLIDTKNGYAHQLFIAQLHKNVIAHLLQRQVQLVPNIPSHQVRRLQDEQAYWNQLQKPHQIPLGPRPYFPIVAEHTGTEIPPISPLPPTDGTAITEYRYDNQGKLEMPAFTPSPDFSPSPVDLSVFRTQTDGSASVSIHELGIPTDGTFTLEIDPRPQMDFANPFAPTPIAPPPLFPSGGH